jgi:hypothetical protein
VSSPGGDEDQVNLPSAVMVSQLGMVARPMSSFSISGWNPARDPGSEGPWGELWCPQPPGEATLASPGGAPLL